MAPDDLTLPRALLPSDGRFGSGPSKVRDEAVATLARVAHGYLGTSHRRDGVRAVVAGIRRGLRDLFSLPDDYEVLLGVGGSTLFWDAASFGLVERRSTHLVLGEFSSKFAQVARAAPHLDDPQICETAPGETPIRPDTDDGDVYAYPHNETSTGVVVDVHRPRGDALVVVDGGGLGFAAGRSDRSAAMVSGWADGHKYATPFVKDTAHRSPVTATIDFDERVDAAALAAALRANGIVDVEPYRKLGRNQLRIAMFPAIDPDDVEALTACIDWVVERQA